MAITNAQQFKQLVNPPMKGKKGPGYRGDAAAKSSGAKSQGRVGGSDVGESRTRSDPRDSGPVDRSTPLQDYNTKVALGMLGDEDYETIDQVPLTQTLEMEESEILKVQARDTNELHVIASILEIQPREVVS